MKLLEKHFEIAINTPDGISRLRALILKLAAQGKLVPQDITEEPAREILKKIKSLNDFESINLNNIPFDKPDGWEWVRLGEIHKFLNGFAFKSNTYTSFSDNQIIRLGNVKNDGLILKKNEAFIPDNIANDKKDYLLRENDILITMTGTKDKKDYCFTTIVNKTDISSKKLFLNQRVGCLRFYENINPQLLNYFLKTDLILNPLFNSSTGTANQANIGVKAIKEVIIPLPPLEEQKRIVEKIEQLMSLCDILEKQRDSKNDILSKINSSAINKLITAEDESSLNEAWQFIQSKFELIFADKKNVFDLKEVILNLAMRGKLATSDSNDPPASNLLLEIAEERKSLVKQKLISKQKELPQIEEYDKKHDLPIGWEWVRLNEYGSWKSGSTPSRTNQSFYGGDIPWVKSGEVKQGRIKETSETITELAIEKCSLHRNPIGSVLIAMYGANIGEVGVLEIEAATNQAVCACKTFSPINNEFLCYLLLSLKSNFISQGAGAAQPNISREKIINTIVPLPPFNEQERIVKKIENLFQLADLLESNIEEFSKKQVQILNSVLANI